MRTRSSNLRGCLTCCYVSRVSVSRVFVSSVLCHVLSVTCFCFTCFYVMCFRVTCSASRVSMSRALCHVLTRVSPPQSVARVTSGTARCVCRADPTRTSAMSETTPRVSSARRGGRRTAERAPPCATCCRTPSDSVSHVGGGDRGRHHGAGGATMCYVLPNALRLGESRGKRKGAPRGGAGATPPGHGQRGAGGAWPGGGGVAGRGGNWDGGGTRKRR